MNSNPWYTEKHGWKNNPFQVKPSPETFTGYTEITETATQYIHNGTIFQIYGQIGTGKTTLVKYLKQYKPRRLTEYQIEYFDASTLKQHQLENNLLSRIKAVFQSGKKRVVFIDESQELDTELSKKLKSMYDEDQIFSIGLVSLQSQLPHLSDSFMDRVGKRKIQMKTMTWEEAQKMIDKRLEEKENPFSEEKMKHIFELSNKSPRKTLENLERVAMNTDPSNASKEGIEQIIDVGKVQQNTDQKQEEASPTETSTEILEKLTPTQQEIVQAVKEESQATSKTLHNSHGIGSSQKSVRTQISRLSDREYLEEKRNISIKVIEVDKSEKPHKYSLSNAGERTLAQD